LRGILNSGHTPSTATIIRIVGDNHEPRCFSTWCPKVIALIGNLPETLEDRSIIVPMRRKAKHEKVTRMRLNRLGKELDPLRRQAARWAKDNLDGLGDAEPGAPEELHDRAADNWEPLLAIADLCGGTWPEVARRAAVLLSGSTDEADTSRSIQLLVDLRDLFEREGVDRLASEQIVHALAAMEERPWAEWRRGKPLSKSQLAGLLKPFGVRPKSIRLQDGATPRGYVLEDLADAFSRYLPSEVQQPQQSKNDAPYSGSEKCNTGPPVAPQEITEKPRQMALVAPVAPREGDREEPEDEGTAPDHRQVEDWEEI
jgi:putative DNA primase/helicase